VLTRRQFLRLGGAASVGAGLIGLYTWQIEPHWVEIIRHPMPLPHLPPQLIGRTLLHVSDLHVGDRVDSDYLIGALLTAGELDPDFVVITGDFVSYRSTTEFRSLAKVLRAMPRGRLATVASLGNHDYGPGWLHTSIADQVAKVVTDSGAQVLRNAVGTYHGLQFAGLGDFWSPEFGRTARSVRSFLGAPPQPATSGELGLAASTIASLDRRKPTVVLCHNPDALDEPIWGELRGWVLSGHTHGGQCKPPFLPPPLLPIRNTRYAAGEVAVAPGRTLYVNRGLGHLLQVRFNVRPEITLFTLSRATA
jgi:predicted MPP superfamily phosphohydrolase